MKKILFLLGFVAVLAGCHESLEDRAARETSEFTKKYCPTPIVKDQRTDSLTFERQSKTLRYYYKLYNDADNEKIILQHKKEIRQSMLNALRNDTKLKNYKDNGFNFRYTYRSNKDDNVVLYDVTFTQKDYK